MDDPRAQRTLVKSPPELWAEISDVEALAGHLGAFGEIRITRLEPETTVAWEGDRARGTVQLEPSGWGTKVTLTARIAPEPPRDPGPVAPPEPEGAGEPVAEAESEPEPTTDEEPEPARRRGFLARLFGRRRRVRPEAHARAEPPARADAKPEPEPQPEPGPVGADAAQAEPVAAPEPAAVAPEPPVPASLDAGRAEAILVGVLDDLGAAHHRPFSRG
jgi:hypothetical protein